MKKIVIVKCQVRCANDSHTLANEILTTICKLAESMRIEIYDEDSGRGTLRHAYIRISKATNDVLLDIVIGSKGLPSSKNFVNALVKKFPQIKTIILILIVLIHR